MINFVISILFISSLTTCVKLVITSIIANEPIDNLLLFIFAFLLVSFACQINLHALDLKFTKHLHHLKNSIFFIIDICNLSLWMQHTHTHTTWSTTLDTPFFLTIWGGKSLTHEESNGDALITLVFFILFHLSWSYFQFCCNSFKKFAITTSMNVFQSLSLNGLQLNSQYLCPQGPHPLC